MRFFFFFFFLREETRPLFPAGSLFADFKSYPPPGEVRSQRE